MIRSMMQIYVSNSKEAVPFYIKTFDGLLGDYVLDNDGMYYHSEINIYGQILSVAEEQSGEISPGTTMQFCLHFSPDDKAIVHKIYDSLKEDASILVPLGPVDYSDLMCDLIDKYGVRWCIFCASE